MAFGRIFYIIFFGFCGLISLSASAGLVGLPTFDFFEFAQAVKNGKLFPNVLKATEEVGAFVLTDVVSSEDEMDFEPVHSTRGLNHRQTVQN
jgi:hypothetical protein